ncbi:hypothetical protein K9M79_00360 [Candidatus Woesearchaeota archaeon]|nr:hypothetical protein [Candidatus Woesearchaeota archaeon]
MSSNLSLKQYNWIILLFSVILISNTADVHAEITLSTNQTDYYYPLNQDAILRINSSNTYKEDVPGQLGYEVSTTINQGNAIFTSINSQSTSHVVPNGDSQIELNLGTASSPQTTTLTQLTFNYEHDGSDFTTTLGEIRIHFVEDPSQQQNQDQGQESTSEENQQSEDKQQQEDQSHDDKTVQHDPSTRMQNSQQSQNMNSVHKQIQDDINKANEEKQQIIDQLSQNEEFARQHREMLDKGYELKSGDVTPGDERSDFKLDYSKPDNNETQSIQGTMVNSSLESISNTLTQQELLDKIESDGRYVNFTDSLMREHQNLSRSVNFYDNDTKVDMNLSKIDPITNQSQKPNAGVHVEFENRTLKTMEFTKDKPNYLWYLIALIIIMVAITFILFRIGSQKTNHKTVISKKPFDFYNEASRILKLSKKEFENGQFKDAYGHVSESVRLYYSHKYQLKSESTNTSILNNLKDRNIKVNDLKTCFSISSMVEFAKYKPNRKDYEQIYMIAQKHIKGLTK